ncbi:hypothetical protein WT58_23980 [Burkholderia territorii]|nr:hypothetical protein WT58_23980 [Burkholderia territorii]
MIEGDAIENQRIKESLDIPIFVIRHCQIVITNNPFKLGLLVHCSLDSLLMVAKQEESIGIPALLLVSFETINLITNRLIQNIPSMIACIDVLGVSTAFELTLAFVIRGQRLHVPKVAKVDNHVRLAIDNVLTNPVEECNIFVRLYLRVRNYNISFSH